MNFINSMMSREDADEKLLDKMISSELRKADSQSREKIKLLLLGTGESGKSTIFKQMKILHGAKWTRNELLVARHIIFANLVRNLHHMLEFVEFRALGDDAPVTLAVGEWIRELWNNHAMKQAWEKRDGFQGQECLEYYCQEANLKRIASGEYWPSPQDILHARVRTSGIREENYVIDNMPFMIIDVGGQRNERKKWIHAFDDVTAVMFVAAISEYDQVLVEDSKVNRMDEAVKLFSEISNNRHLKDAAMILFLNKNDLFRTKLKSVPFRVPGGRNDDFRGPYVETPGANFEECVSAAHEYLTQLFILHQQIFKRQVYVHVTEATNTSHINVVLDACRITILKGLVKTSGFV